MGNDEIPPAPKLHSKGIVATDITAHFCQAAETLQLGELVKDEFFTLFESVGAIEIMDPKMDTGYLAEGETMEDDYDVTERRLPEEILGIMDQMLCFEVAWHMGHPLAQTLFTSLYIDYLLGGSQKTTTQHPVLGNTANQAEIDPLLLVLRSYCLAMIKTCWHVNNRVKSEHYYEEEDFVTHTYNRDLLEDVEDDDIFELLNQACNRLESMDIEANGVDVQVFRGLRDRLDLRSALLHTLILADRRETLVLDLIQSWTTTENLVRRLSETQALGKEVADSFSSKVQRKLASTVPPRPIVNIQFSEATKHLLNLCRDGRTATEVLEYHDSQSLMTFVMLFQAQKPQPSVYIRTLMQHYIFGDMVMLGKYSIRQILDEDLETMVLPADMLLDRLNDDIEVPSDPRYEIAQKMEVFRGRAAQSYVDILRIFCQNRSRVRRTLHHAISDWDNLQFDSEELDIQLHPLIMEVSGVSKHGTEHCDYPLGSWTYYYKLRCMEWNVLLGFELEVYQPWEMAGMYWYYRHLCVTRTQHIERIRSFVTLKLKRHRNTSTIANYKDTAFDSTRSFLNACMLEATATSGLANALFILFTILMRLGIVHDPKYPYSDAEIRYELRMKPFINITLPEPVPFSHFQKAINPTAHSTTTLLDIAISSATRAKKDFEQLGRLDEGTVRYRGSSEAWKKNQKDCLRAVIMCNIGIATVKKAVEKGVEASLRVEIPEQGKGYHDWWVVPKISMM